MGEIVARISPAFSSGATEVLSVDGVVRWAGRRLQPHTWRMLVAVQASSWATVRVVSLAWRWQHAAGSDFRGEGISARLAVQRAHRSVPVLHEAQRPGTGSSSVIAAAKIAVKRMPQTAMGAWNAMRVFSRADR
jgi:hypothetical protein